VNKGFIGRLSLGEDNLTYLSNVMRLVGQLLLQTAKPIVSNEKLVQEAPSLHSWIGALLRELFCLLYNFGRDRVLY
jgi:hypothetical protein